MTATATAIVIGSVGAYIVTGPVAVGVWSAVDKLRGEKVVTTTRDLTICAIVWPLPLFAMTVVGVFRLLGMGFRQLWRGWEAFASRLSSAVEEEVLASAHSMGFKEKTPVLIAQETRMHDENGPPVTTLAHWEN